MSDIELMQTIRSVDCFQGIREEYLERLVAMSRISSHDAGIILFREGDPALASYVVATGTVSLEICAPAIGCRRISTVRDGEFLGWSPVLDNVQLTVTARTVTPTQLVELPKEAILALCDDSPLFGYVFMRGIAQTLARRLNAARMQLLNLFGDEMESAQINQQPHS